MPIAMRGPTKRELRDILLYLAAQYKSAKLHETVDLIGNAAIGVADHYITDGPGYSGKVISIVWPAGPETHEVLYYSEGKLLSSKEG